LLIFRLVIYGKIIGPLVGSGITGLEVNDAVFLTLGNYPSFGLSFETLLETILRSLYFPCYTGGFIFSNAYPFLGLFELLLSSAVN